MLNIICPTFSALFAVLFRMNKPDAGFFDLVAVAAIAAAMAYGWCRLVDWMVARGHNLP